MQQLFTSSSRAYPALAYEPDAASSEDLVQSCRLLLIGDSSPIKKPMAGNSKHRQTGTIFVKSSFAKEYMCVKIAPAAQDRGFVIKSVCYFAATMAVG
jgi:hypothetical protein